MTDPFTLSTRTDMTMAEALFERAELKKLASSENWTNHEQAPFLELIDRRLRVVENIIVESAVAAAERAAEGNQHHD